MATREMAKRNKVVVEIAQEGVVLETLAGIAGPEETGSPVVVEADGDVAPAEPQDSREFHIVASATMEYIVANAALALADVMGSLRLLMSDRRSPFIMADTKLDRDLGPFSFELEEGKYIPLETVKSVIAAAEKQQGRMFAPLLTREAHRAYQEEKLWEVIGYEQLKLVVGKDRGITVDELRSAIEKHQAAAAEYNALQDRRDDGPANVECAVHKDRISQPKRWFWLNKEKTARRTYTIQVDGVAKTFESAGGEYFAIQGKVYVACRDGRDKITEDAEAAGKEKPRFEPMEHAIERARRQAEWLERKNSRSAAEATSTKEFVALLNEEGERRRRSPKDHFRGPGGGQSQWQPSTRRGQRSRRDEKRGGSGPYSGRGDDE